MSLSESGRLLVVSLSIGVHHLAMTGIQTLAVIVTTYNQPVWLDAILSCLSQQQPMSGFEVVIADDGSGPETKATITRWQAMATFPVRHVWQPDNGFRAGEARNRAVAASTADYLVFIDGDCLPFPDFIARHRWLARPNSFVRGNRVLVSELGNSPVLARARAGMLPKHWSHWLGAHFRGELTRLAPLIRLGGWLPRGWRSRRWQGAKTCNLAIWRADFIAVNGFDHVYTGWGMEDSDLVIRLIKNGVRRIEGLHAVPVLHLHHREAARDRLSENVRLLTTMAAGDRRRAECGYAEILADI